ncbi:MAG: type IV secretory system conjugative DNA transfer family protein [Candidatus Paceibacterota bacterium]
MYDPDRVTTFANADSRNRNVEFGIKAKDRTRHVYVIGKTGMGKSTLLENMAVQDIANGEGMAFIDPHGKTAELLLNYVPEHRLKDVLYFAPFDMEHPISFNVLEDVGYDKRHLVVSGLMSTFKKIWLDAWSARMEYILTNTLLALLEYPGSTLLGVNRMLADKDYRKKVVDNIKDPSVKSFWVDEFAKYTDKFAAEATPAIQNKIGQFTNNPLIRNIIGQPKSSFDLRKMMDENKVIIINLSKGRVGEANANLLGSMLITKIYLAAMSRADVSDKDLQKLPNFYLYVDEFQSFANESFADILSEARKYKLNLTIAHQYIEQMSEEVRAAVFGNVGTMITFRVGAFDAEVLEKEFAPQFTAEDLVNLGFAQIYLKLMIDGVSSMPFSATTMPPIKEPEVSFRQKVIETSREQFAMKREIVEQNVQDWHHNKSTSVTPKVEPKVVEKKPIPTPALVSVPAPIPKPIERPKYVKRENPVVVPPKPEPLDDDFVPLDQIKPKITAQNPVKKNVNEKSLAELRAVLESFKKDKVETKPKETIKEIPEEKLRQMLQVEKSN